MNLQDLKKNNNSDMQALQNLFYHIKIKDYFRFLSMYLDKDFYGKQYEIINRYSAADDNYIYKPGEYNSVNPDATIGDLLLIAMKQMSVDKTVSAEEYAERMHIGETIVRGLMINPFYDLFAAEKNKTTNKNNKTEVKL